MGNISVGQFELVYNAFSFTIAVMGAATLFSLLGRSQVAPAYRTALTLTGIARIIHEKCAIKAKPLISFTTMRMGCLMKFFAMKSLAQAGPFSSAVAAWA